MDNKQYQKRDILGRLGAVHTLPFAHPVVEMIQAFVKAESNRGDVRGLVDTLMREPVVTARLLSVANSPLYRRGDDLTSIHEVIQRLGFGMTKGLTMSVLLNDRYQGIVCPAWSMSDFWARAMLLSRCAEYMTMDAGQVALAAEVACIALMSELGLLTLVQLYPTAMVGVLIEAGGLAYDGITTALQQVFPENDHYWVAAELFALWRMPELYCDVVGHLGVSGFVGPYPHVSIIQQARLEVDQLGHDEVADDRLPVRQLLDVERERIKAVLALF